MSVLTLAEAKQHLNITTGGYDAEIQDTIDEAEAMIAERCGPLVPTAVTERVAGGPGGLSLSTTPVISLTSVTPVGGTALTISDLNVSRSGVVTYALSSAAFYAPWYDVIYQAGRASVPPALLRGVKGQLRDLFDDQRPSSARFSSGPEAGPPQVRSRSGVEQAIAPYLQSGI